MDPKFITGRSRLQPSSGATSIDGTDDKERFGVIQIGQDPAPSSPTSLLAKAADISYRTFGQRGLESQADEAEVVCYGGAKDAMPDTHAEAKLTSSFAESSRTDYERNGDYANADDPSGCALEDQLQRSEVFGARCNSAETEGFYDLPTAEHNKMKRPQAVVTRRMVPRPSSYQSGRRLYAYKKLSKGAIRVHNEVNNSCPVISESDSSEASAGLHHENHSRKGGTRHFPSRRCFDHQLYGGTVYRYSPPPPEEFAKFRRVHLLIFLVAFNIISGIITTFYVVAKSSRLHNRIRDMEDRLVRWESSGGPANADSDAAPVPKIGLVVDDRPVFPESNTNNKETVSINEDIADVLTTYPPPFNSTRGTPVLLPNVLPIIQPMKTDVT